jgi:hypothetical protein
MANVWTKFQDPIWRQAAEQRSQTHVGMAWDVTKTDTKQERQHKLTVKDWLFKNNLTEELLLNHPSPDDIKLFQDIRRSDIYDYFTSSDISMIGAIENIVVIKRKSLNSTHRSKIEQAVIRAQRLYKRQIKRLGIRNGREAYTRYKQQISNI